MENIEVIKDKVSSFVEKYPVLNEPLVKLSEQANIDKAYIVIAAAAIPIMLIFALGNGHFLIDLVGFVYPLVQSIKAIETDSKEDDTLWLTYWIIFSLFKVVEGISDFVISFIPFYFFLKAALLVWCYHPKSKGAEKLYALVIKPYVVPYLSVKKTKEN